MEENGRFDWLREDLRDLRQHVEREIAEIMKALSRIEGRLRDIEQWQSAVKAVVKYRAALVSVLVSVGTAIVLQVVNLLVFQH